MVGALAFCTMNLLEVYIWGNVSTLLMASPINQEFEGSI